jgi:hypothetical protein
MSVVVALDFHGAVITTAPGQPGVGPGIAVVREYGPGAGVWRVLKLLDSEGLKASPAPRAHRRALATDPAEGSAAPRDHRPAEPTTISATRRRPSATKTAGTMAAIRRRRGRAGGASRVPAAGLGRESHALVAGEGVDRQYQRRRAVHSRCTGESYHAA